MSAALFAVIGVLCLAGCSSKPDPAAKQPAARVEAVPPPAVSTSAYLNTRPDVPYVGDARCAECHREICESYATHPMGQSMRKVGGLDVHEFDRQAPTSFEVDGLTYSASWDGTQMVHAERRFDGQGELVHEKSEAVAYIVGAGSHGRSYLIERGDSLWMSPMTWYPQEARWALSPGYEKLNQHFTRPVLSDCMFCHSNRAHHRPHTVNLYDPPVFSGLTVGCERCHGPGERHVARQTRGDAADESSDDTIVNPRQLEPGLRDSVCQQCHLAGAVRIVRRGRDQYDYRPGLPWHEYMAVFVKSQGTNEPASITSHEEQMRISRCHISSASKMACISCHDPHRKPNSEEKTSYFRERCNSCHRNAGCKESAESRARTTPEDNCIACHMPAMSSRVQHAAMTDHRIPRQANAAPPESGKSRESGWPLTLFHRDLVDADSPEFQRDLAVALMQSNYPGQVNLQTQYDVVRILTAAVDRDPRDFDAVEALAHAQLGLNHTAEALATIDAGVEKSPHNEHLLAGAMSIAASNQKWDSAQDYSDRLIAVNPHHVHYRQMAIQIAIGKRDADAAVKACEKVLELDPADRQVRQILIQLLEGQRRLREAQRHSEVLNRSAPRP
ncbi:MAG: hypothetical protein HY290_15875 [Planctomycetia bacterium]|nr:hypothetical protein [Planctomycetia bacterium]